MSRTDHPGAAPQEDPDEQDAHPATTRSARAGLRLVHSRPEPDQGRHRSPRRAAVDPCAGDEAGTTTAEYTVVTGAAVAFGALLFKLLTSQWGTRILSTAFSHVIALLGF